jgi:hypothetical protein
VAGRSELVLDAFLPNCRPTAGRWGAVKVEAELADALAAALAELKQGTLAAIRPLRDHHLPA